jgi:hypothetical protein
MLDGEDMGLAGEQAHYRIASWGPGTSRAVNISSALIKAS